MARVNIDDKLWSDPRFDALRIKMGGDEEKAIGRMAKIFRMSQEYWRFDKGLIPISVWDLYEYRNVEEVGLAERRIDGIYVMGSEERHEWLRKKSAAGVRSAEVRREKFGTSQPIKSTENSNTSRTHVRESSNTSRTPPEPLTLTPSPSLKNINKPPCPEWLNFGQSWLDFALKHTKVKKPPASWTPENFGRELAKVSRSTGLTLDQLLEAMKWADTDNFWADKITSPSGLLGKAQNGNRKVDNLLAALHKSKNGGKPPAKSIDSLYQNLTKLGD